MKTKLFRIVSGVFILSSLLNMAIIQPTHADAVSDQQAVGLIGQCKGKVGPFPPDSDCGKYTICLTSAGKPTDDDVCKSVRAFDGIVTALPAAALAGCVGAKKSKEDCTAAYGNCLYLHVKDNKISADDTKTCTGLITKGDLDAANKDPKADKTTCVIQGIGWLICPVMTLLAKVVDAAYLFVSSLLTVQPLLTDTGDANNTIYQAWSIMRNIANVAFVIAFLVIILSQVSSIGISNYGIKKLLPRIIVSAILVNISYWICAIAVDASNIIGVSFNGLFDSINAKLIAPDSASVAGAQGTGWEGITGGVLAGTAAVGALLYVGVSALLPALIMVLLAIVVVFLVLTLRQALIILLIVVAPLAFVAYLLPNTESWFKKWRELLQTLLLMYPIIAIMFGASALASKIVMTSASGPYKIAIQIMGAMIAIMPLALTPIVMKSAGGLLNRFGGIINNPNRGPFDRMRKGAQGVNERAKVNRGLRALDPSKRSMKFRARRINYKNRKDAVAAGRAEQFQDMQKEAIATMATNNPDFAEKVAGDKAGYYAAKQAQYLASVDPGKLQLEVDRAEIANAVDNLKLSVTDPAKAIEQHADTLAEAIKGGDSVTARAAQQILMGSGKSGKSALRDALDTADPESEVGTQLRKDIQGSDIKGSAADVYAWSTDKNHRKLSDVAKDKGTWEGLSDTQLQGQVKESLEAGVNSGGITKAKAQSAVEARGAESMGKKEANVLRAQAGLPLVE